MTEFHPQNLARASLNYSHWLYERGYMRTTIRTYESHVAVFVHFIQQQYSNRVTTWPDLMQEYVTHLKESHQAGSATINNHLTAINLLLKSQGINLPAIAREKRISAQAEPLSPADQQAIIRVCLTLDARDRAIVFLFLFTGIRIGECATLNLHNIIREGTSIKIKVTEAQHCRVVTLEHLPAEALEQWLTARNHIYAANNTPAVFVSKNGGRLPTSAIDTIVRNAGHRASLVISASVLRHSYFAELAKRGINKEELIRLSGSKRMSFLASYPRLVSNQKASPQIANS